MIYDKDTAIRRINELEQELERCREQRNWLYEYCAYGLRQRFRKQFEEEK